MNGAVNHNEQGIPQIFEFEGQEVRVYMINGEPWWAVPDLCRVLGIQRTSDLIRRLQPQDVVTGSTRGSGVGSQMKLINEYGLYDAILISRKPQAREFRDWITHEVLPAINHTGMYVAPNMPTVPTVPNDVYSLFTPEFFEQIGAQMRYLQEGIAERDEVIAELTPKANYHDLIMATPGAVTVTAIAKDFGLSAIQLNRILHEEHIQFKVGDQWVLYQEHAHKGWVVSRTAVTKTWEDNSKSTIMYTLWTQKGRKMIYELLKSRGILPLVERPEWQALSSAN